MPSLYDRQDEMKATVFSVANWVPARRKFGMQKVCAQCINEVKTVVAIDDWSS